jgi:hypothetical protein
MPRKQIGPDLPLAAARLDLAKQLAAELKSNREYGQPVIYEQTFRTGMARVNVLWDRWNGHSLEQRTSTILRAFEMVEGPGALDRVVLATGMTIPEAVAAGMLPYQIIPVLRPGDPVDRDQVRQAMLEEGASDLIPGEWPHLRCSTLQEAEAAHDRLNQRLKLPVPLWLINKDLSANDYSHALDWTEDNEG